MQNNKSNVINNSNGSRLTVTSNQSFEKAMYRFKVILLGNVSVGKTSILSQFIDSTYTNTYTCTINIDYRVSSLLIDENIVSDLQIWDTCGSEAYKSLTKLYYRDTHGKNIMLYINIY